MAQVIALSRPTYNWDDPDHSHLIFHSSDNSPKLAIRGNSVLTVAANSTGSIDITHNLGYIPTFNGYFFDPVQQAYYPHSVNYINFSSNIQMVMYGASTQVHIAITNNNATSQTITFYYDILYEGSA